MTDHVGLLTVSISDWSPIPGVPPLAGTWPDGEHVGAEFRRLRDALAITGPVLRLREPHAHPDGVLEAWAALYREVPAGGTVVVHASIHGTRVPNLDGREEDGWDEAWCLSPGDAQTQDEYWRKGLLIDDRVGAFLTEFGQRHLTLIIGDFCHPATAHRAMTPLSWDVVERGIPYGGPEPDPERAAVDTMRTACSMAEAPVVFFAAALANQTAADLRVGGCSRCALSPPGIAPHMLDRHGALSYAIWQQWSRDPDWQRLSFAELWTRAMEWPRWRALTQIPTVDYGAVCGVDPGMRVLGGLAG